MASVEPSEHSSEITASIWFIPTWPRLSRPSPFVPPEERQRLLDDDHRAYRRQMTDPGLDVEAAVGQFNGRFGIPQCARRSTAVAPRSTWPGWYEARDMIAIAMGAREPRWIDGAWWHDRERHAFDGLETAADVARIAVPDWGQTPIVQRMLEAITGWQAAHPEEPAPDPGITCLIMAPGRGWLNSIAYPSFVDMGVYLVGMTRFLTLLAGEPETADALMELCFDLSTSYVDYLLSIRPMPMEMLCGFGGDATCLLSPALYHRYGAEWDRRLFAHAQQTYGVPDDLPCNYHSCGPSGHLYEAWSVHPCRVKITTIQTRLLPGAVSRLRASLPQTLLELTLHPPHVDAANLPAEELRAILLDAVRAAGGRNAAFSICLIVHHPDALPQVMACIETLMKVMDDIQI